MATNEKFIMVYGNNQIWSNDDERAFQSEFPEESCHPVLSNQTTDPETGELLDNVIF